MPASPNRRNTTKALLALTLASGGVAAAAYAGISATANSTSQRKSRSMSSLLHFTEVESGQNPEFSIIWMHGLGDEGRSFVSLVKELDLSCTGAIRFIFPDAPMMPVTLNNGYVMRSWYDIMGADIAQREDEAGLRVSQIEIEKLILREIQRGIPSSRIFLAGFSQGCVMSLQTGLRYPEKLAGLICLSGYMPLADKIAAERDAANHDIPIFQGHGSHDPVVPLRLAEQARDLLNSLGYSVEWHQYFMQHSIIPQEIQDLSAWLSRVCAAIRQG